MENLVIFENEELGKVRVIDVDGDPWFVGKDVAVILGYSNTRDALLKHVESDEKAAVAIHDGSQNREMTIINESGLYSLILSSKLESAKKFKKWVTSEVLPSIRKTGKYSVEIPSYMIEDPATRARRWAEEWEEKQKLLVENVEMQPKAEFYDAVTGSDTVCDLGTVAKTLNMGIGRNNLFKLLKKESVLQSNSRPYQKQVDLGRFRVVESRFTKANGDESVYFKTVVLQKGIEFIRNLLIEKGYKQVDKEKRNNNN